MKNIINKRIKKNILCIADFVLLALFFSCGNESKISDVQTVVDSVVQTQVVDTFSTTNSLENQDIAPESKTVDSALYHSWIVDDDPVLNECAQDTSYLWNLIKIEAVDYSPINDSIRKILSNITMGMTYGWLEDNYEKCYYSIVLNGHLRFTCKEQKVNTDKFFDIDKNTVYRPTFMGHGDVFKSYFKKEYQKLGIDISDSINTLYTKLKNILAPENSEWVLYHNINDYAFVGDANHCCFVIASKYILWFSRHPYLAPKYLMKSNDTIDHFFEDPRISFESINVDTMQKVICSTKQIVYSDSDPGIFEETNKPEKYDHIIFNTYDGYKCYLGEIPMGGVAFKVSKQYKTHNILIAMAQFGDETSNYCRLYVYDDISKINEESSSLEISCVEESDPFENQGDFRFLDFKIYEDFTIRVDGRRRIGDKVDYVTRYYRIDDNGKIYELKGN